EAGEHVACRGEGGPVFEKLQAQGAGAGPRPPGTGKESPEHVPEDHNRTPRGGPTPCRSGRPAALTGRESGPRRRRLGPGPPGREALRGGRGQETAVNSGDLAEGLFRVRRSPTTLWING